MMQGIQGHHDLKRHINDDLNRGSSIVTQLIGGLALGGGVGAVVTAGGGLLPGAVIGAILGVVAPGLLTRITKRRSQEDSKN
jgi:outer membrane lipoprotein SlyB